MAKRKGASRSGPARWLWGVGGARLFDPAGLEFEPTQAGLSRETVVRLVNSHEVPVAIHGCGGAVSWRIAAEASVAWRSVSPGFEDVADWRPRTGAPGELPYRAELWRALSGDGRVLVFRND